VSLVDVVDLIGRACVEQLDLVQAAREEYERYSDWL